MQTIAMRRLYQKGYVATSEVILPNQKRADIIVYKEDEIVIIEVKASRATISVIQNGKNIYRIVIHFISYSIFLP